MIGQRVGPYVVLQRLGGGGMGEVYLAEDTRLGRQVALKRPSEAWLAMPDARDRLHREASAAGRLTHPNIAAIYDVLDVDAHPYIVMEYVEGESLAHVLRRGALPLDNAIAVGTEIAEALAAAHAKGIVHRDLKPANISLTHDGHAKVLDFGLAKGPAAKEPTSRPGLSTITVPGQAMGTPGYSSPEQLVGAPADPRDDIYSLGVVLYELLTGRRPFDGTDSLELAMATMTKTPPPVHQVNPTVPETISAIVARAMARDRDDRYPSADQLRTELRRLTHALSTDVTHLIDSRALKVPGRRGRRVVQALAALALIAAGAAGLWSWRQSRNRTAGTRPPVLGVMAFVNSSSESDAPLAASMRDLLIARLANTPGLVLLSKSAIDEAARQHAGPRRLAKDLDATHLLEITVLRSGRDLMLSATLSHGDSGAIVWNESVAGPDANVAELQQRVADGIRRALLIPAAVAGDQPNPGTNDVLALTHYGRATILLERPDVAGNLARAEALLREATQRDPKFALAWARLGDTYWENYKISAETRWASDAVNATNTALTLDQRQPEVWIALAKINEGTGRREAALSALSKALELQQTSDEARQLMGQIFLAMGRRDEAKEQYLQAIRLRPDYWRHHSMLGAFYYAIGNYPEAIAAFTRVTRLAPDNARGFHNLGAVYYRIGDSGNALANYEKALAINPRPETRSAIGNIHYDEGRYQAALDAFLEAAKGSANDGVLRGNVGDAYARLGRVEQARQAWREAVRLEQQTFAVNPNDVNALARIALWEAKSGDRAGAEGHITRALAMGAGDAEVLYYSAIVRALAGDTERALASLEQAVKSGYSTQLAAKDRDLDAIRDTPRFRALISSAGK